MKWWFHPMSGLNDGAPIKPLGFVVYGNSCRGAGRAVGPIGQEGSPMVERAQRPALPLDGLMAIDTLCVGLSGLKTHWRSNP